MKIAYQHQYMVFPFQPDYVLHCWFPDTFPLHQEILTHSMVKIYMTWKSASKASTSASADGFDKWIKYQANVTNKQVSIQILYSYNTMNCIVDFLIHSLYTKKSLPTAWTHQVRNCGQMICEFDKWDKGFIF